MKEITMYVVRDKTDKSLFKSKDGMSVLEDANFYKNTDNANRAIGKLYGNSRSNAEVVPVKITVLK